MLNLIAPLSRKRSVCTIDQDTDSESENNSVARTSTAVKTIIATNPKTTPVNSRNMVTGVLNDSTNQPTKRPKQQRMHSEQKKTDPLHRRCCSNPNRRRSHLPTYSQCRKHSLLCFQFSMVSPKNLNFLRTYFEITSKCTFISRRFKN